MQLGASVLSTCLCSCIGPCPHLGGLVPWSPQEPIAELLHAQRPHTVSEAFCRFDASLPALLLLCFSTRFPLTEIMSTMGLCGEDC